MFNDEKEFKLTPSRGAVAFLLSLLMMNVVVIVVVFAISLITGVPYDILMAKDYITFLSLALSQVSIFFVCFFVVRGKKNLLENCSMKEPTRKKDLLMSVVIFFGIFFGMTLLSGLFMLFLQLFGYTPTLDTPFPDFTLPINFIFGLIVVGVLPAICEELLFRGVILSSMKRFGKWPAILFSSLAFMLLHASPMQTLYQFAVGVVLALIVWETGNIYYAMIIHFLNNAAAVVLEFFSVSDIPPYLIIAGIVLLVLALAYFLKKKDVMRKEDVFEISMPEASDERVNQIFLIEEKIKNRTDATQSILFYAVGFLFCIVMWIMQFALGLI